MATLGTSPLTLSLLALSITLLASTAHSMPNPPTAQKHAKAHTKAQAKKPGKTATPPSASSQQPLYQTRADVMSQVPALADATQLDPNWVRHIIGQAQYLPTVSRLVLPPAIGVKKNWRSYRERFVEPARINAGVLFWKTHEKTLERAEKEYGVPAKYIVGIIGIESLYGRHTGNFRVIDVLTTLAFDFPKEHPKASARQAFFRQELEQFLLFSKKNTTDPLLTKGSYAGATGLPQFMPSSIARFAVDFDGDGTINLQDSVSDTIGSVANYFKSFQWQPDAPTHFNIQIDPQQLDLKTLLAPDILPTFSQADLSAKGVTLLPADASYPGKLALVELQNGDDVPSYVAGTNNFYTITRYNWSSYYAMAVIDLGEAVKAALPN